MHCNINFINCAPHYYFLHLILLWIRNSDDYDVRCIYGISILRAGIYLLLLGCPPDLSFLNCNELVPYICNSFLIKFVCIF